MSNHTTDDRNRIPYVEQMRSEFMDAAERETADTRRRVGRLTVPAFAAVLVLVVSAVGAAAWVLTRPLNAPRDVTCYQEGFLGGDAISPPPSTDDPVDRCAQVDPDFADGIACADDRGAIAVFPQQGDNLCENLGLDPLPADYQQQVDRHAELQAALEAALPPDDSCLDAHDARRRLRDVLEEHDAAGWTIDVAEPDHHTPCATLGFVEPGDQTVSVRWRETRAVTDTKYALYERFQAECVPPSDAVEIVERELTDAGYKDFEVRLEDAQPDGCAMLSSEEATPGQPVIIYLTTQSR